MALEIIAFVSFRSQPNGDWAPDQLNPNNQDSERYWPGDPIKKKALFPTDSDLLLSALEPFRDSTDVRIKVYDLSTTLGRFQGLLHGVLEAPAVIVDGQRFVGWQAAQPALNRLQKEVA